MADDQQQRHNAIEFISTGRACMREPMAGQPISNRNVLLRQLRCFRGAWTPWAPIGVFVVRHRDGPILIDTGSSPACMAPGYFSAWGYLTTTLTRLDVKPDEGVVGQLAARGVVPSDLQAIVLTHLHHDHAGGLADILTAAPNVPVFVGAEHWEAFGLHQVYAAVQGCTPAHWPANFAPTLLRFDGEAVGPWKASSNVTADGTIRAVQTSGHVKGHISIIVTDEWGREGNENEHEATSGTTYLIAGDATYNLDLLDKEMPDGANSDPMTAWETLRTIKEFARQRDVVVLPSHDPDTPTLLDEKRVFRPTQGT